MNIPLKLKNEELQRKMKDFPLWTLEDNSIVREFVCSNFPSAVGYVNAVAVLVETLGHHPDILIYGWNKVRIKSSTHDAGGLTELDFRLAERIEELGFGL